MEFFGYPFELDSFSTITIYCIVVLMITWLSSKVIRFFLIKYINRKNKNEQPSITRLKFIKNSVKFFAGIVAFLVIVFTVPAFSNKATLIFSGAGILAAIIGFAAQAAVSNLIAGAFIVIFRPFRVGDFIKLDDLRMGIVEDITLRHTIIKSFENKRIIIPNSIISTESVLNHTIEDSFILSFTYFGIGLYTDIDKAKKIITEEALQLPYTIDNRTPDEILEKKPQVPMRITDINENGINILAMVWVKEPFDEYKLKSDLREAVHKRFIAEDVEMPIPMRKIVENK